MPFASLDTLLPEIAREETRSLRTMGEDGEVARTFLFAEMFCDEAGCDCRRAFVQVLSDERGVAQPRAMLSWGWEPPEFYQRWAGFPLSPADMDELRGPALVRLERQSEEAEALLDAFRWMLSDEAYAARIRRHYALFRERIDGSAGVTDPLALLADSAPSNALTNKVRNRKKAERKARRRGR